jgi:LuxR family transcriptional regulator, maltose regulon positive regulatory protein
MQHVRTRRDPKYVIPKRYKFSVEREALLQILQEASDVKLIMVVAPAGYGKTTLLAQLARRSHSPAVWLSLTADDSEAINLSRSVAMAARYTVPGLKLERYEQADVPTAGSAQLASALASDLNRVPENLVFILEELEHLSADSGRWLISFIQNLGEGHQVVASSRGEIEADFSRFVASGETLSVTIDDLTFTPQESAELLEQAGSTVDFGETHKACDGWPAAIGMVAHGAPLKTPSHALVLGIFKGLEPDLREALPEAAVSQIWSERMCQQIGCYLPPAWLRRVRRSGLPMLPLGHDSYRPHRVVLDVLDTFLSQRPTRHAELHLAAAQQAESRGELLSALHHLRIGGHVTKALRLLEELLPRWEMRSDWSLVRHALQPLSTEQLSSRLKTALGIALIETGEPAKGEILLHQQIGDGSANGLAYFGLAIVSYRQGKLQETLDRANDGLGIAQDQREIIQLLRAKAVAQNDLDIDEEALGAAQECVRRAERLGDVSLLVAALSVLQYIISNRGNLEESIKLGRRAVELAFAAGVPFKAFGAVDNLIYADRLLGRSDRSLELIEHMLKIGETEYPLAVPRMLAKRADHYALIFRFEEAIQDYTRALAEHEAFGDYTEVAAVAGKLAESNGQLGRFEEAVQWLAKARETTDFDHETSAAKYWLSEGIFHFCSGNLARAQTSLLKHTRYQRDDPGYLADTITVNAYLAEIDRRRGELTIEQVEKLIASIDTFGHSWPLESEAQQLAGLCQTCIERGWFAERFKSFLTARPATPRQRVHPVLEISTLGGFHVSLSGRGVSLSPKGSELLVYLALHGPCHTEVLADALWPSLPLDAARNNLKGQMRLLRLSLEDAGFPKSDLQLWDKNLGYRLPPLLEVWCDTQELERALESTDSEVQLATLKHYHGDFLKDSDAAWVIEARSHYREVAVALSLALGAATETSSPEYSLKIYHRAAEIEPLTEEAHEAIKRIGLRVGNVAEVKLAERALEQARRGEIPNYPRRTLN